MILTADAVQAGFAKRYPGAGGVTPSIEAGARVGGQVAAVDAAAVKTAPLPVGKLQYVRAKSHFFVAGELVQEGDYVQVQKDIATRLVRNDQAEAVTEDEVRQAEAEEAAAPKGKK